MQTVLEPILTEAKGSQFSRVGILWQSAGLFTAFGYSGAGMSDVAHASVVTKAAIYDHFTDKETFGLETLRIRPERLALELGRMIDSPDELEPVLKRIATFCSTTDSVITASIRPISPLWRVRNVVGSISRRHMRSSPACLLTWQRYSARARSHQMSISPLRCRCSSRWLVDSPAPRSGLLDGASTEDQHGDR